MVKIKKISFFSSIVLIVASTIGAGIFFKNRELTSMSHGDILLVIFTWIIAIVGIVALGMALIEVTSAKKLQRGILGWTKMFCPQWFHRATMKYQRFFFIPVTLFSLSLYVTQTFVDAGWAIKNGWLVLTISFAVFLFFMIINLLSLKVAEAAQWVTTIVQLIPLFVLPIIAFANIGHVGDREVEPDKGFIGLTKWMVLLGGLPAIFFAYDGFYTVAELRNDLKAPNKIGKSLTWGIVIISSIYLFLTIAFNLGSRDGSPNGILSLAPWAKKMFNICIALGIMGIINGYTIAAPRLYRSMLQHDEAKDVGFVHYKLYKDSTNEHHQFISSWIYLLFTTTLFFIVFGLIAIFSPLAINDEYGEGKKLYDLAGILLNYSSLLIFVVIATVVLGALIHRKNNKFGVKKIRFFKTYSIISITMFYFSLFFMIMNSIINLSGINNVKVAQEAIQLSIFLGVLLAVTFPEILLLLKRKKTPRKKVEQITK